MCLFWFSSSLTQFIIFLNLLNYIYLSFSKPNSSFIHILPHVHYLATLLVGKEQMHLEGVIFICVYGQSF